MSARDTLYQQRFRGIFRLAVTSFLTGTNHIIIDKVKILISEAYSFGRLARSLLCGLPSRTQGIPPIGKHKFLIMCRKSTLFI